MSSLLNQQKKHEVMIIIMMICVQECHSGCESFSLNHDNYLKDANTNMSNLVARLM